MDQKKESPENGEKNAGGVQLNQKPLLSKIRNLNHFSLTSFGSLFSGNISKAKTGNQHIRNGSETASDSWFELGQLEHRPQQAGTLDANNHDGFQADRACPILDNSEVHPSSPGIAYDLQNARDCRPAKAYDEPVPNQHPFHIRSPELAHISTPFPEMRVPFGKISNSGSRFPLVLGDSRVSIDDGQRGRTCPESVSSSEPLAYTAVFPSASSFDGSVLSSPFESQSISQHGLSGGTPPLTPDSLNAGFSPSIAVPLDSLTDASLGSFSRFSFQFGSSDTSDDFLNIYKSDNNGVYNGRCLREIKEGKKPEKIVDQNVNGESDAFNASDDPEEWYGLEYTLEVSSRERQPSESQSFCVGEHSKSRESWAAIHKGTIHPFFEDEDYRQWKNWHHFLDRQDEKRRHKKGFEFKARSKNLAWIYVDEIRTRDVLYWQKEVFGVVARDVKERLQFLVERRPDPYHPPQEHNWPWYLKRSRSVACLRELEPKPPVG